MNLGFEYLLRNKLNMEFLRFPCSIFMSKKEDSQEKRMAAYIDQSDKKYIVTQWMITDCKADHALPPMHEFYVSDVIKDFKKIVPSGYQVIDYIPSVVINRQNSWRHPMTSDLYNSFSDQVSESPWHSSYKSLWLWESFIQVYECKSTIGMPMLSVDFHNLRSHRYPINLAYMCRSIINVKQLLPKVYNYWTMWKDKILKMDVCNGEFAFADFNECLEKERLRREAREKSVKLRTLSLHSTHSELSWLLEQYADHVAPPPTETDL